MHVSRTRRDYRTVDADGRLSAPIASWRSAKLTGMPVKSKKVVERYVVWPTKVESVTLRRPTLAERADRFFWLLGCFPF